MFRRSVGMLSGFFLACACSPADSGESKLDAGSDAAADASPSVTPKDPPSTNGNKEAGAPQSNTSDAGPAKPGSSVDASAPPDASQPEPGSCQKASDCELPETVPEDCAVAACEQGVCQFVSKDADSDGFSGKRCTSLTPGVSVQTGDDCDDQDETVNPNGWDGPEGDGFADGCNDDIDQDCNGLFDDGQLISGGTCLCEPGESGVCSTTVAGALITYPTLEQGRPVGACQFGTRECLPNGTWGTCNGAVAPMPETCDGNDNDCDGVASLNDEDVVDESTFVCDNDKDNHAPSSGAVEVVACRAPTTGCENGQWLMDPGAGVFDDCDDNDAQRNPDETEVCNNRDDDCDGDMDEEGAIGEKHWSYDADADQYRNQLYPTYFSCHPPQTAPEECTGNCPADGWVDRTVAPLPTNDCDDTDPTRNPGATDQCNGVDQDCDGSPLSGCECGPDDEEECGTHPQDGQGICKAGIQTCSGGEYTKCMGSVGPEVELCGLTDYDCDGTPGNTDEDANDKEKWVCDADRDGRLAVSGAVEVHACLEPPANACNAGNGDWIENPVSSRFDDCDDTDGEVYPSAAELCDGKDNNCNDKVDAEEALSGAPTNPGVTYECQDGAWEITMCPTDWRHCDDNVENGCETDDTALATCRGCNNVCLYACGGAGCVEAKQVSAGFRHSCLIDDSGTAACFGDNAESQLGNGDTNRQLAPRAVSLLSGISAISAGEGHSCAIALPSQTVYCWGDDTNGELGNGGSGDTTTPSGIPTLTGAISVAAGAAHSCAVASGGAVYCWGAQQNGKLGDYCSFDGGSCTGSVQSPGPVFDTSFVAVAGAVQVGVGREHSCARLNGGEVLCWGSNSDGQLGDGTGDASSDWVRTVSDIDDATDLAVGDYHACVVQAGEVLCWGKNGSKQTGQSDEAFFNTPQKVPGLSGVTHVRAGSGFTCALTSGGEVVCWGDNSFGQTTADSATATANQTTLPLTAVSALALGPEHACAVAEGTQAWCWGLNADGQLGNGLTSASPSIEPTTIRPLNKN